VNIAAAANNDKCVRWDHADFNGLHCARSNTCSVQYIPAWQLVNFIFKPQLDYITLE